MDCDFSPSSPHLLPNGLFSPQNRISFELLALSGLSGFSTFKGGKMLIFQGFANSRIVREFPPFSFKVRIATLTRNQFASNRTRVRIPPSPPKALENTTFSRVFTLSWWCPLFVNGALGALICGALGVLLYSVYSSKMNTVVPLWCPNVLKTYKK